MKKTVDLETDIHKIVPPASPLLFVACSAPDLLSPRQYGLALR